MRQTYTFVVLDLSSEAFNEIKKKLDAAGYQHCFTQSGGRDVIDMQGIAVASEAQPERETVAESRRRKHPLTTLPGGKAQSA
jgi:hypothetical protein